LAQVLRPLKGTFNPSDYPNLLVGLAEPDDSAVYRMNDEQAIVVSTDFFPPVVDDAYTFGAIAAANALSDIYAMGGKPIMAINLAAYPDGLPMSYLTDIMRGGADKVKEAGAVIAGGHTVADKEPKYGLSVTGTVHPDKIVRKSGAQVGDVLFLTKPLGAGVITTALKRGVATDEEVADAVKGMSHLNAKASEIAVAHGVNAMTDITGFGLMGHAHELAHLSGIGLQIQFEGLEWYQGVEKHAKDDVFAGGMHRNQDFYKEWVTVDANLAEWQVNLLYDPQTSGGLLLSIDPKQADTLAKALVDAGETCLRVGTVVEMKEGHLQVV